MNKWVNEWVNWLEEWLEILNIYLNWIVSYTLPANKNLICFSCHKTNSAIWTMYMFTYNSELCHNSNCATNPTTKGLRYLLAHNVLSFNYITVNIVAVPCLIMYMKNYKPLKSYRSTSIPLASCQRRAESLLYEARAHQGLWSWGTDQLWVAQTVSANHLQRTSINIVNNGFILILPTCTRIGEELLMSKHSITEMLRSF